MDIVDRSYIIVGILVNILEPKSLYHEYRTYYINRISKENFFSLNHGYEIYTI